MTKTPARSPSAATFPAIRGTACGSGSMPPSRVAITTWRYRALRRAGLARDAKRLLEAVEDEAVLSTPPESRYKATVIRPDSNEHYYRCLLLDRGLRTQEQMLNEIAASPHWARLGRVAASADLARLERA